MDGLQSVRIFIATPLRLAAVAAQARGMRFGGASLELLAVAAALIAAWR